MPSLLKTAKGLTVAQLTGITDATYVGDPSGTPVNKAWATGNNHNYLSALIKATVPKRLYYIDEDYASIGDPFFATIPAAFTQLTTDGCSSSNKAGILLHPKGSSYDEDLAFNQASFYFVVKGEMRDACDISGDIAVSNGVVIFENVRLSGDIAVTGGTAVFINCYRNSGAFSLSNGATVIIANCENFGKVAVTGNNNTLWIENLGSMEKDNGTSRSVDLAASMTGGTYVFRNIRFEGTLYEGTAATEVENCVQNATARPNY